MRSFIMVAKKSSQAIRMNLIRTHRKVVKQRNQVSQELKILILGEVVTPPVDDVTKYGPVDGDSITSTEEIPFDKNANLIQT